MNATNPPVIGHILARHRKARHLTLEQLSSLSGVSRSMLSEIERNNVNPTFAVIWSVTSALQIDLRDLVDPAAGEGQQIHVVSASGTPEIRSADGSCRLRILSPPHMAGTTEWYDIEMGGGGELDSAPHTPGAIEHFTAFTDGFEITSADKVSRLKKGETARYAADVPHRIANRSARTSRGLLVVVYRG